jgi:hypothetical protein
MRNHDQPGCHPDAHAQTPIQSDVEAGKRLHDRECGTDGALRLAFVRQRVAEIGDDAVPLDLRDKAFEALYAGDAGFMVAGENRPIFLRVVAVRQSGRADQIAKQHGDLAALAFIVDRLARQGGRHPVDRGPLKRRHIRAARGEQYPFAMTQRDAESLEVSVGQRGQQADVHVVVFERRGIPFQTQLREPPPDVVHGPLPVCRRPLRLQHECTPVHAVEHAVECAGSLAQTTDEFRAASDVSLAVPVHQ